MSANQLISMKLDEIYVLTNRDEILLLKTMDLTMIKNMHSKNTIMKLINDFILIKKIDDAKKYKIDLCVNEIYKLL